MKFYIIAIYIYILLHFNIASADINGVAEDLSILPENIEYLNEYETDLYLKFYEEKQRNILIDKYKSIVLQNNTHNLNLRCHDDAELSNILHRLIIKSKYNDSVLYKKILKDVDKLSTYYIEWTSYKKLEDQEPLDSPESIIQAVDLMGSIDSQISGFAILQADLIRQQSSDAKIVSYALSEKMRPLKCKIRNMIGKRIDEILDQTGWLTPPVFSEKLTKAFWLMIQHQDQNLALQKKALELMEKEVLNGTIKPEFYAYLLDRVLINSGFPQKFGTQLNNCKPVTVDNPELVKIRRQNYDMSDVNDYIKIVPGC